jgi:putative transposase
LPSQLVALIEGMALRRPPASTATIHRRITAVATAPGWPVPSYSTVYAIVRALDPAMVTLAHDGPAAFRDRFALVYRHQAARPNALWQADHTELDILIPDANGGPWLTTVLDDHSRALAGYTVFLGAPSALQTSLALRQAIWRKPDPGWQVCGIPDVGRRRPAHPAGSTPLSLAPRAGARWSGCCAPRGARSYPRPSREELGGRFLGLMAYPMPKG